MISLEDRRRIAKKALQATRALEKAVAKGDIDLVKQAIANGAIPEWGTYPNKKGATMGSLVGRCLRQKNLELLDLLIETGAPILGDQGKSFIKTAITAQFPEAIARVAHRIKPSDQDVVDALGAGLWYFKPLDEAHHVDRLTPISAVPDGLPVIFHAKHVDTINYLVETGADPCVAAVSVLSNLVSWTPSEWHIGRFADMEDEALPRFNTSQGVALTGDESLLDLLQAFVKHGDTLTEDYLQMVVSKGHLDVAAWMIEQEPALRIPVEPENNLNKPSIYHWLCKRPKLHAALLAHQKALDLERNTQVAVGVSVGRRM